jgi:hypothetical protein
MNDVLTIKLEGKLFYQLNKFYLNWNKQKHEVNYSYKSWLIMHDEINISRSCHYIDIKFFSHFYLFNKFVDFVDTTAQDRGFNSEVKDSFKCYFLLVVFKLIWLNYFWDVCSIFQLLHEF